MQKMVGEMPTPNANYQEQIFIDLKFIRSAFFIKTNLKEKYMELTMMFIVVIMIMAFLCEYVDSALGMGYGTILTPIFMLMGFQVNEIVPAILVSELCTGLFASFCHHKEGNVNFKPYNYDFLKIYEIMYPRTYLSILRKSLTTPLKIVLVFAICCPIAAFAAVYVGSSISKFWLNMYVGILVLTMGILIFIFFNRKIKFSFKKVIGLGLFSSFNKGLSGGGYGPIMTAGQIFSGVEGKNAVGITSFAESFTCAAGIIAYLCKGNTNWGLAPWITVGALLVVPLAAKSVKYISETKLKAAIAILTIILGSLIIYKTLSA